MPRRKAETKPAESSGQSVLDDALERFKHYEEAWSEVRKAALEDFDFRFGEQYSQEILNLRKGQNLPCLTINRIPKTLGIITNEYRQQKPSPQIDPNGDGASTDTAQIFEGIIRHIDNLSDAEIARDTAFEHMATGGFGFYRIRTKYMDDDSFDQELCVEAIENPFAVYWDPYCSLLYPDRANGAFIIDDPSPDEYKVQYPNSDLAANSAILSGIGTAPPGWINKGQNPSIRVAEHFFIKQDKTKLYLLKDGTIAKEKPENGNLVARDRDVISRKVKWIKINAVEILDETDWLGQWIPIIPMFGDTSKINGKLRIIGLVRDAKDPQRSYNYWISRAAQACQVAPNAPYIAVAGSIEKYKAEWETANIKVPVVLRYDAVDVKGQPAPPPKRDVAEPPIQAMAEMIRQADNDFKVVTGLFDPSLGKQHSDESGKAVEARQKQGETANFAFTDNAARAVRYETRIKLDLIPKYYNKQKLQRIIDPDGTTRQVRITNSKAMTDEPMAGESPDQSAEGYEIQ